MHASHAPLQGISQQIPSVADGVTEHASQQKQAMLAYAEHGPDGTRHRDALLAHAQTARAEAQAERDRQHALFMRAPVAIAILEGPDHRFTFANPAYRASVNGRDVVNKPLHEALPDVKDQGFDKLLDQVMATGETF